MAIVRWSPASELGSLQGDMNRLFNTFLGAPEQGAPASRRWVPAMDLFETPSHFVARMDLPGMSEEQLDIEVRENVLAIAGERAPEGREEADGWYRFERPAGRFSRQLQLPEGVDADAIEAQLEGGVLELRIPKPEQRQPRKVAIGQRPVIEG